MKQINCLGDMCPIPVMKLKQCKDLKNSGDSVQLVTDHSCTVESISDLCAKEGLLIDITEPMNGIWELVITKP